MEDLKKEKELYEKEFVAYSRKLLRWTEGIRRDFDAGRINAAKKDIGILIEDTMSEMGD